HEIWREYRGVPPGSHGRGEVHGYDGVDRQFQGRGATGPNARYDPQTLARPYPTAPAQRQDGIDPALQALRTGPDGSDIRQQTAVPEHEGHRKVRRNREGVPYEWRVEVDPQRAELVWQRENPIGQPGAAHVCHHVGGRTDYRKNCHGLRRAVNGVTPVLAEQ